MLVSFHQVSMVYIDFINAHFVANVSLLSRYLQTKIIVRRKNSEEIATQQHSVCNSERKKKKEKSPINRLLKPNNPGIRKHVAPISDV
jgi:hypothetical protein